MIDDSDAEVVRRAYLADGREELQRITMHGSAGVFLTSADQQRTYIASSDHSVRVRELAELVSTTIGLGGRTISLGLEEMRGRIGPMANRSRRLPCSPARRHAASSGGRRRTPRS